ncbi:MAG: hypothetical protein Q9173_006407 [Seirophora scorigena]
MSTMTPSAAMASNSFIYLCIAWLFFLVSSSAIPPSEPFTLGRPPLLEPDPGTNVSVLNPFPRSTWSMRGSTPFASISEVEQTFKKLAFRPPTCDGSRYGRNLQADSCQEVLLSIPRDQKIISFGKRNRGQWNINLPHRFLSRSLTRLDDGAADGFEIARAAWAVITSCVHGFKHEGGRADGLGTNKKLSVKVITYNSHVRCAAPGQYHAPPLDACETIIDQMPADSQSRVFGPPGFHVDIEVPLAYTDPTKTCEMVIRPNLFKEAPDESTWYEIWAAAVAVRQQCVLPRRAGQADSVGEPSHDERLV